MNRQWLFLISTLLFPAACASSPDAESGEADLTASGTGRSLSAISYSDLGTTIYVSGTTVFFEGKSQLYLRNESDPSQNAPLSAVGHHPGIAATSVDGQNGLGPFTRAGFDVSFEKNGQLSLKAEN